MKIEGDTIIFTSGRKRDANNGIIGIGADMDVSEGYDGGFYTGPDGEEWHNEEDRLTKEDLLELAEYMIDQWTKFKTMV